MTFREVVEAIGVVLDAAGVLAILVRTFLSTALQVELEGQWPWQRGPRHG